MASRIFLLLALLVPAVLADSRLLEQLPSSQFSGFFKLLEQANLIPELEASLAANPALTIFAPTDDVLLHHTSTTLMAYLKAAENKEALRDILRSHFVPGALSPFQWEGRHQTLASSQLELSMDSQAFYAGNLAILKYNALLANDGAVHSIPALLVPQNNGKVALFAQEGSDLRRVLKTAAAPAPSGTSLPDEQPPVTVPQVPETNGAVSKAIASAVSCGTALLFAAALL